MKVLHLLKTSTGATWALRQLRELVKLGVEVHVALPQGPLVAAYQDVGVTTHILQTGIDIKKPWTNISRFKALRNLVENISPNIIHSHFVATTLTMRLALGRNHSIKRIFHVPGPLHLEHTFFRKVELLTAGKADFWLGSCRWTVKAYQRFGISPHRIGLVYYGVDIDQFQAGLTANLHQELNLAPDIQIIGNVAYFYAPKKHLGQKRGLKGHEDLIDAIDMASKDKKNIVGVFVGGPWDGCQDYMDEVIEYANNKEYGRYYFLGLRHDVQNLYGDFTLTVHPSHSENVGGAVESLFCQSPTIATDIGGFPDLVIPNKTGWLVPSKNPKALAEKIINSLDSPEQRQIFSQQGRRLAQQMFDVRHNAADIFDYYQKLLTNGELGVDDD
jgi:glycosyltransferase involved in cell wall biosynthesis